MKSTPELSSIVALLAVLSPVVGSADTPSVAGRWSTELGLALRRGAVTRVEEIAARVSISDLSRALSDSDREVVLGVIAAAPTVDDGWLLLEPLAAAAAGPDRPIAAAAAAAAVEIAAGLDGEFALDNDLAGDELQGRLSTWRAVATKPGLWPDVRVHALEVCAALARARRGASMAGWNEGIGYDLAGAVADREPEVRRAAFELLPGVLPEKVRAQAVELAAAAVLDDPDPEVALAAAQWICGEAGRAGLGERGSSRLRDLLGNTELAPAGLLGGARCLAGDGEEATRAALDKLRSRGPKSIRRRIRRLMSRKTGGRR